MFSRILPATLILAGLAHAAVTRVEVADRTDLPIANYEQITGKVYFAVDPKLPANRTIADIDLAPKNAKGLVEFSSDLIVLRPKDAAKSNGTALLEISNRGNRGMLGMFDLNNGRQLRTKEDFGDPLLFDQGFTLVWVGWEFDVPDRAGLMHLYAPVIKGITGPVRSEIEMDKKATSVSLGDRAQTPYIADPASTASATMTVRDHIDSPRTTIPRAQWNFTTDGGHVEYPAGFEPGRYYEVVYTAKDPALVGLGPAAIRDYISYIKQNGDGQNIKRAIGFGTSQSGRFLRTYLYYGFNADEKGKQVFDGVWAHVAGAGRGSFNLRFAQPSRDGNPIEKISIPSTSSRSPTNPKPTKVSPIPSSPAPPKTASYRRFSIPTVPMNTGDARHPSSTNRRRKERRAARAQHAHLLQHRRIARRERRARLPQHAGPAQSGRLPLRHARAAYGYERVDHQRRRAARFADPAHRQRRSGEPAGAVVSAHSRT